MRSLALVALVACHGGHPEVAPALGFGPLALDLVVDARASRFHAVDQLSAWYPAHHVAFAALLSEPTTAEQAALAEQRALRAEHPWGRGLEAAYYLGRADAVDAATRAREDATLAALEPRIAPFVARTQPHVEHFARGLAAELARGAPTLQRVGRLFGATPRRVPVVLVARPGGGIGGGGANGGVLVVEVTDDELSATALIHELGHALIEPVRARVAAAARTCGVDATLFEEAIAHAIAPGLVHDGGGDPLATTHARFYAEGLAVRPALERALATGDLAAFLDDVCARLSPGDRR